MSSFPGSERKTSENGRPGASSVVGALLFPLERQRHVGALCGQPPAEKPPGQKAAAADEKWSAPPRDPALEQLLLEALRNSPEIQLAEAKLREAEALLRQTRMSVMQKVLEQQAAVAMPSSMPAHWRWRETRHNRAFAGFAAWSAVAA